MEAQDILEAKNNDKKFKDSEARLKKLNRLEIKNKRLCAAFILLRRILIIGCTVEPMGIKTMTGAYICLPSVSIIPVIFWIMAHSYKKK